MIDGIILGDKLKKNTLYRTDSYWGRLVIWTMNPELADKHYFQHYASTNRTMFVCRALFPTRMDLSRLFVSKGGRIVNCFDYEVGLFDGWMKEEEGDWSYIWSTFGGARLVAALSVVRLITLIGLNGNNFVRYGHSHTCNLLSYSSFIVGTVVLSSSCSYDLMTWETINGWRLVNVPANVLPIIHLFATRWLTFGQLWWLLVSKVTAIGTPRYVNLWDPGILSCHEYTQCHTADTIRHSL